MRFLVTVIPAIALTLAMILAWRFPIDRETYRRYPATSAGLAASGHRRTGVVVDPTLASLPEFPTLTRT